MWRRSMAYSDTDGCFDGGRTVYSNTAEECYDSTKQCHGYGHDHGMTNMYCHNTQEYYDAPMHGHDHGHGMANMYSNTSTNVESFDAGKNSHGHGMSYSHNTEEEHYGGGQGYYKMENMEHKNRERMGKVGGALAAGALAMNKGHEVKKGPAHTQRGLTGRIPFDRFL